MLKPTVGMVLQSEVSRGTKIKDGQELRSRRRARLGIWGQADGKNLLDLEFCALPATMPVSDRSSTSPILAPDLPKAP